MKFETLNRHLKNDIPIELAVFIRRQLKKGTMARDRSATYLDADTFKYTLHGDNLTGHIVVEYDALGAYLKDYSYTQEIEVKK